MDIFYKTQMPYHINLEWEVTRGKTLVREDFSRADVWLFMTSENGMCWLSANIVDNVIHAEIPRALNAGMYGFKIIWAKDSTGSKSLNELLACRKLCVSEVLGVFAVSDYNDSETNASRNVKLKLRSSVATYGYDGLNAYERAVMLGLTRESEENWLRVRSPFEPGLGEKSLVLSGVGSTADGDYAVSIGKATDAEGTGSHAEGWNTKAIGIASHTEGTNTRAHGRRSHAEGYETRANGEASHAEGSKSIAEGKYSHAGGYNSIAEGQYAFAHGNNVKTNNNGEVAIGSYNLSTQKQSGVTGTLFSCGNGTGESVRKNAFEIMDNGDIMIWWHDTYVRLQDLLDALSVNASAPHLIPEDLPDVDDEGSGESGNDGQQEISDIMWYVGQITKSRTEFSELTAEQLVAACTAYPTSTKEANIAINHSCWFVMVPEGEDISSARYTAGGVTNAFTEQEIKDGFVSGVSHGDVTIDGRTYKVYVNRNTALIGSDAAGKFTLK